MIDSLIQPAFLFVIGSLLSGMAALGVLILAQRPSTGSIRAMTLGGKATLGFPASSIGMYLAEITSFKSASDFLGIQVFKVVDKRTDSLSRVSYCAIESFRGRLILHYFFWSESDINDDQIHQLHTVSAEQWTEILKGLTRFQLGRLRRKGESGSPAITSPVLELLTSLRDDE